MQSTHLLIKYITQNFFFPHLWCLVCLLHCGTFCLSNSLWPRSTLGGAGWKYNSNEFEIDHFFQNPVPPSRIGGFSLWLPFYHSRVERITRTAVSNCWRWSHNSGSSETTRCGAAVFFSCSTLTAVIQLGLHTHWGSAYIIGPPRPHDIFWSLCAILTLTRIHETWSSAIQTVNILWLWNYERTVERNSTLDPKGLIPPLLRVRSISSIWNSVWDEIVTLTSS